MNADTYTGAIPAMNPEKKTATVIGAGLAERKLGKFLLANQDRQFSRSQVLDKVRGNQIAIEERTADAHVLRLRKALKDQECLIKTIRSVGYMFSEK
jgi:two-component system phosphate regulon response regulator PhoB